jgi:predicted RNA polymerase sigma factor
MRPALCEEAMRLGRVLAGLLPDEPEVHGLVALMELHASRMPARTGPTGEAILLLEQLGGAGGPYALQAAIAACHARALVPEATNWARIAALYHALGDRIPSPVIELNRAVAVAMAFGPAAGLTIVDELASDDALEGYHLLPSTRGDLLDKLGRYDEARAEFERAAEMTRNARERTVLLDRAAACAARARPS